MRTWAESSGFPARPATRSSVATSIAACRERPTGAVVPAATACLPTHASPQTRWAQSDPPVRRATHVRHSSRQSPQSRIPCLIMTGSCAS